MRLAIATIVVAIVCVSVTCAFIDTGSDVQYTVELDIFSGRPNPRWVIGRGNPMYGQIVSAIQRTPPTRIPSVLGYRGFIIQASNAFRQVGIKTVAVASNPILENILLDSCPFPIQSEVRRHFTATLRGMTKYPNTRDTFVAGGFFPKKKKKYCKHPRFDPENWNFPPVQGSNNCYNYASQRQTGTFAQPGRATGEIYTDITAPSVRAATWRDGFVSLPFFAPHFFKGFCYMALVIWPNVDFHFYRMDNNFRWSHKPGGTEATDQDNSGDPIFDPLWADRGNYIVFAGYLGNHPAAVVG